MVIALALFNELRSLGRERLGLSTGLRGNGMAFTRELLRRVPPAAFSVVEDVEYGLDLGEAGIRVHAPEAYVLGEMTSGGRAATSQRRRWERGRASMARTRGPSLLLQGILQRDLVRVDLALDLLLPPLTTIALMAAGGTVAAVLWHHVFAGSAATTVPWLLSVAFLVLYVVRGLRSLGAGVRGVLTLLWAPVYIGWKLGLGLRGGAHGSEPWVRRTRKRAGMSMVEDFGAPGPRRRAPALGCSLERLARTLAGARASVPPRRSVKPPEKTAAPAALPALDPPLELGDPVVWQKLWLATQRRPWKTLALIPADSRIATPRIAAALAQVGTSHLGFDVKAVDATAIAFDGLKTMQAHGWAVP